MFKHCIVPLTLGALFLLAADKKAPHVEKVLTGKVVGISDGDTLTILDESKTQHKIRLYGVDAPEKGQAFGTKSKEALGDKIFGKAVRVDQMATDRYGRAVGKVLLGNRLINREMVAEGWAWDYVQYDPHKEFAAAEADARRAKHGLWADKEPVPPWDFRKAGRGDKSEAGAGDEDPKSATVYVTKGGKKYHRAECTHLGKSKIATTLEEARGKYEPCATCNPPK